MECVRWGGGETGWSGGGETGWSSTNMISVQSESWKMRYCLPTEGREWRKLLALMLKVSEGVWEDLREDRLGQREQQE